MRYDDIAELAAAAGYDEGGLRSLVERLFCRPIEALSPGQEEYELLRIEADAEVLRAGYRLVRSGEAADLERQIPIGCVLVLGPCGGAGCIDDPEVILKRLRALTALERRES